MSNAETREHPGAALLRLSEAGDFTAWRALFTPDAVMWHNTDLTDKKIDDVVQALIPIRRKATAWKYTVVERVDVEDGFLQRFVLDAETGGEKVTLAACLSCRMRDGLISRLDEYLDSAAFTQLAGA
jgi:uncharacterized protein